jgi:hypothetical protein
LERSPITNLFGDIEVINKLFGFTTPMDRTRKIANAINHPLKPNEIPQSEAPCQEEVLTEDLDVNKWITAIRHTELESELTIGSGISCVIGPYFEGGSHIGYNRMNFRWGNVGTFQASPGSHMWQIQTKHYKDDNPRSTAAAPSGCSCTWPSRNARWRRWFGWCSAAARWSCSSATSKPARSTCPIAR